MKSSRRVPTTPASPIPGPLRFIPIRLQRRSRPFDDHNFLHEIKYDGFRTIAVMAEDRCRLFSRNGFEFKRYVELAQAIPSCVRAKTAVLDCELVSLDHFGRADFPALLFRRRRPVLFAFDLLELNGEDWRPRPLIQRKQRLRRLLSSSTGEVRYVDHVIGAGQAFFEACCEVQIEGMVSKKCSDPYDAVSTKWWKVKNPIYQALHAERWRWFEKSREGRR